MKKFYNKKINTKLYKKLFDIEKKGYKTVFGKIFPNYQKKVNTKNITFFKNSMVDIAQENLYMYKRLKDKAPTYDLNKLLKDYAKSQYYKQNACRYTSIDFYKFKKSNSIDSNNNKENMRVYKTENNYFPKISKTITSNFSNYKNNYKNDNIKTVEELESLKRRKIKRKKKFKNFNFKDLKNLKAVKIKNKEQLNNCNINNINNLDEKNKYCKSEKNLINSNNKNKESNNENNSKNDYYSILNKEESENENGEGSGSDYDLNEKSKGKDE